MDPIEHPDRFSEYLRKRLEDHRMPPEADGWDAIDVRLNRPPVLRRRLLVAAVLAVAVLTGLVWLIRPVDTPLLEEKAEQPEVVMPIPSEPVVPLTVESEQSSSPALPTSSRLHLLAVKAPTVPAEKPAVVPIPENTPDLSEDIPVEAIPDPAESAATSADQVKKKSEATVPIDQKNSQLFLADNDPIQRRSSLHNHSSWQVGAGFGTGSSVSLSSFAYSNQDYENDPQNNYNPFPTDAYGNFPPKALSDLTKPPSAIQYSDITYHLPLSFGLTVRKNLSSRFSVESGLMYTYLHNTYRGHDKMHYQSEYHLHYLGIPVNAVVYFTNQTKWNVYLSTGIMAEKGVYATYTNTYYQSYGDASTYSGKTSLGGLQWSINAALGISYRILRHWSLYAEPRFSYYFDNNQPETIRTEHAVTIGIGGGIRYEF